ncbi:MAG: hypothetical protein ACLTDR_10940 [Adlercreutzia equolifaciens]
MLVDRFKPTERRRRVCLVPPGCVTLVPGTVRDNLLFPWTLKGERAGSPEAPMTTLNEMLSWRCLMA